MISGFQLDLNGVLARVVILPFVFLFVVLRATPILSKKEADHLSLTSDISASLIPVFPLQFARFISRVLYCRNRN